MGSMILEFNKVSFHYGGVAPILDQVTFGLGGDGDRICLIGPSGSGKSTVMKLALGLLASDSGTVTNLAARPLPILQNFHSSMLPWFNLEHNIWFGSATRDERKLHELAELLELQSILRSRPYEVSGGQLQRAILARALYHGPDLLLVDEPLAHVDIPTTNRLLPRLSDYLRRHGTSVLWITHRALESQLLSAKVILLENGVTVSQQVPNPS